MRQSREPPPPSTGWDCPERGDPAGQVPVVIPDRASGRSEVQISGPDGDPEGAAGDHAYRLS